MTDRLSSFCVGVVLVGTIAALSLPEATADNSDFAIIGPHEEVICAKSQETCHTALKAIQKGWWTPFGSRDVSLLRCVSKPDCFPERSNCIEGYNCR